MFTRLAARTGLHTDFNPRVFQQFARSLYQVRVLRKDEMVVENNDVERLEKKAQQAEDLIAFLKTQIQNLEQHVQSKGSFAYSAEIKQLRQENDRLRQEASQLKKDLETLEVQNGATLVPLPSKSKTTPAVAPQVAQAAPAKAAEKPQKQEQKQAKEKKTENTENAEKGKQKGKEKGGKGNGKAAAPAEESAVVDVSRLDMRIGKIVNVKKHPDADALYVEEIDVGENQPRTVVSGLVKHVPIEKMQDRLVIVLCNLKPAKMRGILSQAMVMCASTPEKVELLDPPTGAEIGDVIHFEGFPGTPDAQLNPKKKIFEKIQPEFKVTDELVATWRGDPFKVKGKEGLCKSQTLKGVGIK